MAPSPTSGRAGGAIRIGVSIEGSFPAGTERPVRLALQRTDAAWKAGLDSLFVGDQHATAVPTFQNLPFLARLLSGWGDRTVGSLHLLPLWHPVILAEQIATVAAMADGPYVLICTLGAGDAQFAAMGVTLASRRRRFEEGLRVVRALLEGDRVDSPELGVRQAAIRPAAPGTVVWIGGTADPAVQRAARLGDGWIVGPRLPIPAAAALADRYLSYCDAAGRAPQAVAIRRDVHVTGDDGEAVRRRKVAPPGPVPPEDLIIGTVDQVEEEFRRLATLGFTDVLVRHFAPDPAAVVDSLHRLGEVRERLS